VYLWANERVRIEREQVEERERERERERSGERDKKSDESSAYRSFRAFSSKIFYASAETR
jgi:hypothetical protein